MSRRRKAKRRVSSWTPPKSQEGAPLQSELQEGDRSGRRRRLILLAAAAIALPLIAIPIVLVFALAGGESGPPRAAIVDQLDLTFPNPEFVASTTELLEEAGYVVDYYAGEQVTVDVYRALPSQDYDIVLVRAHAGRIRVDGELTDDSPLFTGQPYTETGYLDDQLAGRLVISHDNFGSPPVFGIPAEFVRSGMDGDFDGATVVLMGCDVLRAEGLADAFIGRGAGAVIGWDDQVSASHTDEATENFLEHLVGDGLSVEESVALTMTEVGPDPVFDASLRLHTEG